MQRMGLPSREQYLFRKLKYLSIKIFEVTVPDFNRLLGRPIIAYELNDLFGGAEGIFLKM
jgi:hypothetical protein